VEVAQFIETLRQEGARMTAAARAAATVVRVPTCPEWEARDLIRHTGGVHRWATSYVAEPQTEMRKESLDEIVGRWPGDEELSDWFEAGYLALARALEAAPADLQTWTFLRAPSPLVMWSRRQAHETAIHRVDTELTSGRSEADLSPFTPDFAADGVDELLMCFVPRRSTGLRAEKVATLGIGCVDDDAAWALTIGPEGVTTARGDGEGAADCTVRGAAADLYLALWNRGRGDRLSIEGDRSVLDAFGDAVQVRWA
jgi:uncharacterized protein (TIGR03083 family)